MTSTILMFGTFVVVPQPETPPEFDRGAPMSHDGGGTTIYLNRDGGRYTRAQDDSRMNYASAIQSEAADVPAYAYGDDSWDQVIDCVRDLYAPFDVTVTDVDPGDSPHTECVVGGAGYDIGLPDVGGVASFACAVIPNSVCFVFPEHSGDDPRAICETIGQETAHTFGLDHAFLCEDVLTYLDGCGDKSFRDEDAQCGERSPRACLCGGATQNSYRMLLGALGAHPDGEPPAVSIASPADGDVVPPGFEIVVDATDDGEVVGVDVRLDGVTIGSAPRVSAPADVADGAHEIEAIVTDDSGLTASARISVVVDAAAPRPGDDDDDGNVADADDGYVDLNGDGGGRGVGGCSSAPGAPEGLALCSLLLLAVLPRRLGSLRRLP